MKTAALGATLAATTALGTLVSAQTIQIATHYNEEQMAPLLACFDAYEAANPGVTIEFQQAAYGDFLQTILTSRIGGTSPDIYNIYSIWAPQLAGAGALAEPPAEIQDWVRASYGAGTVGAATINGILWGIPTELSVYQLVYNKPLLAAAGFDAPPATWDELQAIAAAITVRNDQGVISTAGYAFGESVATATHPYYSLMYAAGVPPFSADGRTTNFTTPESVEIVERMAALFSEGITSTTNTVWDMSAGTLGMGIIANWNKAEYQSIFGDAFADTIGVAPIPTEGPGGTMLYTFLWAVDSTSDVPAESWALLRWLNEAQEGASLSCTGQMLNALGALSGNLADLAAMDTADSFTAPYVAAIESGAAQTQPNVWQAAEVDRVLHGYITQVWAGNMAAADALAAADAEVTAILAEQP
jgi:multiple sugar transport system substrate-binding protein